MLLVRHAEKQTGPDPSLSEEGRVRALALRELLISAGVDVLVASQFKRTSETLQPLADTLGLEIVIRPLDTADVGASAREVVRGLADEFVGQTILIAGHSNTIPAMASALTGEEMPEFDERDYDNLLILSPMDGAASRAVRLHFGAPDGVD